MPLLKRKTVSVIPPPEALNRVAPQTPVWYIEATGECFLNYEAFARRMIHLQRPIFQCSYSGKLGLSYFEAVESEKRESKIVNDRFVEELKGPVLRRCQWQVCGRLDALVDKVFDRFKDRFWVGETVSVELGGDRYLSEILKVTPPPNVKSHFSAIKLLTLPTSPNTASTSARKVRDNLDYRPIIHLLGTDLDLDLNTIKKIDDPAGYVYSIRVLSSEKNPDKDRYSGIESEVGNISLSRDRTSFSKAILKRFLKECLDRNSAVGSPWTVKSDLAKEFGVKTEETQELKDKLKKAREGKLEKRKKTWTENKDVKRRKGELGEVVPVKEKVAGASKVKGKNKGKEVEVDADPVKEEKTSPKKLKYPTEDLDLDPMSIFDGRLLRRQSDLPTLPVKPSLHKDFMGISPDLIDSLLNVYTFVNVYGKPLQISPFTLDDFMRAILHSDSDIPCPLIGEVHSVLLNQIIIDSLRVPGSQNSARSRLAGDDTPTPFHKNLKKCLDVTKNWDRVRLKLEKAREGWEKALIGCLLQRGGLEKLPMEMERIVAHFALSDADLKLGLERTDSQFVPDTGMSQLSQLSDDEGPDFYHRYVTLPVKDKIKALAFLCDLVVPYSKAIRIHIEETEAMLTEMRKEKVEWGREKKRLLVDKSDSHANTPAIGDTSIKLSDGKNLKPPKSNIIPSNSSAAPSTSQLSAHSSSSQLSEPEDDQEIDELASSSDEAATTSQPAISIKAKQKTSELQDSLSALSKKEENWEKDFRRIYHIPRTRPLGQDRFYNTYWWFDGLGGVEKTIAYGTGRLLVQGPHPTDWHIICEKESGEENAIQRVSRETGNDAALLQCNEWGWLESEEEVEQLLTWLNNKGNREHQLKAMVLKWKSGILGCSIKRQSDLTTTQKQKPVQEMRRSTRTTTNVSERNKEPYLTWTNRAPFMKS